MSEGGREGKRFYVDPHSLTHLRGSFGFFFWRVLVLVLALGFSSFIRFPKPPALMCQV